MKDFDPDLHFHREKPCRICGSHIFYIRKPQCVACRRNYESAVGYGYKKKFKWTYTPTEEDYTLMVELFKSHITPHEIGDKFNCRTSVVKDILITQGILDEQYRNKPFDPRAERGNKRRNGRGISSKRREDNSVSDTNDK